jgi:hypothetical protein
MDGENMMNMFTDKLIHTFNRFGIAVLEISYTFYGTGCEMVIKPGYSTVIIDGAKSKNS